MFFQVPRLADCDIHEDFPTENIYMRACVTRSTNYGLVLDYIELT
jgi:hypothetical protein